MKDLIIFAENCIADAPMLLIKAIFVSLLVGIVYAAAIGINIVHADGELNGRAGSANVHEVHHPTNAHDIQYGYSIIAENFYTLRNQQRAGNYDIQYDGNTCMRWLTDSMPVVVANPSIITYSDPIDDFDLLNIIACEA